MPLSRKQQITHFRPMVDRAWKEHCYRECITESTPASKREWYEEQLLKCCGVRSSKKIDASDGFEKIMAWFEAIVGDGIRWQMRLVNGNQRRAIFLLNQEAQDLGVGTEYMAAVSEQMGFGRKVEDHSIEELLKIRLALRYHGKRRAA